MPQTLTPVASHTPTPTPTAAPPLTEADYQWMLDAFKSGDPKQQADATAVAKTLTQPEANAFFKFQQDWWAKSNPPLSDYDRPDRNILGVAPEAAVALGVGGARAIKAGVGAVGKYAGGLAGAEAKYWGTKTILKALHVPDWMAESAAVAVSNMGGKGAATAAEAETAETAATMPAAKPGMSAPLPAAESPIAAQKATAPAPSSPPPTPGKIRLNADEATELTRLSKRGVPLKDALGQIQAQREMVARQGLPTTAETKAAVAARNASGRWAADSTVGKGPVPPTSAITIDTPIGTAVQVNPKAPITLTLKSNGARLAFESKAALDEFLASRKGR